jgi:aminotransferase
MNDITAAIGINQIAKVPGYISRRNEIHDLYQSGLQNIEELILPSEIDSHSKSSYYFYTIKTDYRDELAKFLLEHDIYSTFRYWPLHKMKLFNSLNSVLPSTEQVSRTALNIPLHQSLSNDEVEYIIETIRQFFRERH